jgi:hypothetical protein
MGKQTTDLIHERKPISDSMIGKARISIVVDKDGVVIQMSRETITKEMVEYAQRHRDISDIYNYTFTLCLKDDDSLIGDRMYPAFVSSNTQFHFEIFKHIMVGAYLPYNLIMENLDPEQTKVSELVTFDKDRGKFIVNSEDFRYVPKQTSSFAVTVENNIIRSDDADRLVKDINRMDNHLNVGRRKLFGLKINYSGINIDTAKKIARLLRGVN